MVVTIHAITRHVNLYATACNRSLGTMHNWTERWHNDKIMNEKSSKCEATPMFSMSSPHKTHDHQHYSRAGTRRTMNRAVHGALKTKPEPLTSTYIPKPNALHIMRPSTLPKTLKDQNRKLRPRIHSPVESRMTARRPTREMLLLVTEHLGS